MKLVYAVDAIFTPLTGIGRYALELARQLEASSAIADLRYYSMGRWVSDLNVLTQPAHPVSQRSAMVALRRWAAQKAWAVRLYEAGMPWVARARLTPYRHYLFHSPNYFVPARAGLSIATVHDHSIDRYPETHPKVRVGFFKREFPESLRRASFLITDSAFVRDETIQRYGWPVDRIKSIPLGVDHRFSPCSNAELQPVLARLGLLPGQYALCVSTLEPRKNIDKLLQAFSQLSPAIKKQYPLVVAGSRGWLSDAIHDQLQSAEREGWARYLNYLPDDVLPYLYAGARGFCFPSSYEGFGLPVLEAMASGVPVLTSDRSSLPEVAGGAALLVDPDDADALRDQLERLLTDDRWRDSAAALGLAVAAEATWEKCAARTIDVYRKVWEMRGEE